MAERYVGWKELEDQLVEIHGLEGPLEPSEETKRESPGIDSVDANGKQGRVIGWSDRDEKYIVETFDGEVLGIAQENLRVYEPAAPEDGGFDCAWPSGSVSQESFAHAVVSCLAERGFCVIQMFAGEQTTRGAAELAQELDEWHLPVRDLEVPYLGYDNNTKYANLPQDMSQEADNELSMCDRTLTNLGLMLTPLVEPTFNFKIWGRRSGMVRVPLTGSTEESILRPSPLDESDYAAGGKVYGHINFLERRKLQIMYMIHNEGGELMLYPTNTGECTMPNVRLPLSGNKMLVFLPQIMSYSYKPRGDNLLLQTWYVSPPFVSSLEDTRVVTLPQLHQDRRSMIMSLEFRFPGSSHGPEHAMAMWLVGGDGAVKIPANRFDIESYYSDTPYSGMLYTNHGGCIDDLLVTGFDNEFFGLSHQEATFMGPVQRNLLETGYEALRSAGHSKRTTRGLACGVYLGSAGSDWLYQAFAMQCQQAAQCDMCPRLQAGCNSGVSSGRLSHTLGMRGPCVTVDTACSSSLVAFSQAQRTLGQKLKDQRAPTARARLNHTLVMGVCMLDGPETFFAYCAAMMLSKSGRSFTFDEGANGFLRGEGCCAAFISSGESEEEAQQMLACSVACATNQDGRSASLTAPNGPSQAACIRASMQEAGLTASMITMAECHGTGTTLGDPIEVGALKSVMWDRDVPAIVTSSKTSFGHMEACAGLGGVAKCVIALFNMSATPNLHIKCLNPHLEAEGFPAAFPVEIEDFGTRAAIAGVSSFGIGGTNARGDLWGRGIVGRLASSEILNTQELRKRALQYGRVERTGTPGPDTSDRVFITGSWDAWAGTTEMEVLADGEYGCTVAVGETCQERFRLLLNGDGRQALYPEVDLGSGQRPTVLGPDFQDDGRSFLLDARAGGAPVGAAYRIRFEWGFSWELGEHKRLSWERLQDEDVDVLHVDGRAFDHRYFIAGTWTSWRGKPMEAVAGCEGLHRVKVRIGIRGEEAFQILQDNDSKQVLYPAVGGGKELVPVKGPDKDGEGKHWLVRGQTGEFCTVELTVFEGTIAVTTRSPSHGNMTWTSFDNNRWHEYFVVGSWLEGGLLQLRQVKQKSGTKRIYRCTVTLGQRGWEEFHICVNMDEGQIMYPKKGGSGMGEARVCGPDAQGVGMYWQITGRPHQLLEITLDLDEEDRLRTVSWRDPAEERGLEAAPAALRDA